MEGLTEFKRMNFFTGFFTTARDWNDGQHYHLEKRKLHNRRLHTPGVMRGERDELKVKPAGGLTLEVGPGAALDAEGNEVYLGKKEQRTVAPGSDTLPRHYFVAIRYREYESDRVDNKENPEYSGYRRWTESFDLEVLDRVPDNREWLELARIHLVSASNPITAPEDPENPGGNEVDRRYVKWAGSSAAPVSEEVLEPELLERLVELMERTRKDFAALAGRFPVPSAADVRHAAIAVEMLARTACLRPEHLTSVVATLAAIEHDVGQEIGAAYSGVAGMAEFANYQDTVSALLDDIRAGKDAETLFTRQDEVALAARELSEVVQQPPAADAGADATVTTGSDEATVPLDASASRAYGGREIVRYRWDRKG